MLMERKRGLSKLNRVMILAAETAAFALAGCGPSRSTLLREISNTHHEALESYARQIKACDADARPWGTVQRCKEEAEHSLAFHEQLLRDGFQAMRDDRLIDALENRRR